MIQKRINNDIIINRRLEDKFGNPIDLSQASFIYVDVRPATSNARIPVHHEINGDVIKIEFLAKDQKEIGIYNVFLYYTIPNPTSKYGKDIITIDFCNEFELLPNTKD